MTRQPFIPPACAALLLGLAVAPAIAADWSFSGFGTLGYARSDRSYTYQRFIDDDGTWQRDSKLGAQLDLNLSPQWAVTGQAMFKPAEREDRKFALQSTWLFASWRPNNDILFRLGKQRTPLFLNSENMDVGQTYEFVRLPAEMYALSPTQDFTGLYGSHTWLQEAGEFSAEAMYGTTMFWQRIHARDLGTSYVGIDSKISSLVLNWRDERSRWRVGWHHTRSGRADGSDIPVSYPYVTSMGPVGFYQVQGGPATRSFSNDVFVVGGDVEVAPGWRVVAEAARNVQHDIQVCPSTAAAYLAVIHQTGPWSPYVSLARQVSLGAGAEAINQLDAAVVLPGQDEFSQGINLGQRVVADYFPAIYQTSLALGTSYALTPTSKLKVEWMQTQIGRRSSLVDSPAGGPPIRDQGVRVWSLNYNFTF